MKIFSALDLWTVVQMFIAAVCIYLYIMLITRIAGKRTFAKMTSIDFAVTIAMGSILADAVNKPVSSLMPAFVSIVLLVGLQVVFSKLFASSNSFERLVTNTPILLMRDGKILEENLKKALVSRSDLLAKLREANVLQFSQVKAVVFETTGDISVLHTSDDMLLDTTIMEDVDS
ncbi:MAG: DUF421 domain-containing protein [Pricia sp.]|nr:DUF421 domain-containing protein [Pricia sp.]